VDALNSEIHLKNKMEDRELKEAERIERKIRRENEKKLKLEAIERI
jgi:hypothetical protein